MKDSFFRSMTWLHTWVGLLFCWLLWLVFFAGTLSFFRQEITLWSKPELHQHSMTVQSSQQDLLDYGFNRLKTEAPDAARWWISLPSERNPLLRVSHLPYAQPGEKASWVNHNLAADSKAPITTRETKGGSFFYRLHFDLHYIDRTTARWIVCLASLFMLVALISGIVIHKRIFKDMFQFRTGKGSRSWLDGHNLSSVLALPFHLMITYTGLITLIFTLFPYPAQTVYEGGVKEFRKEFYPERQRPQQSHETLSTPAFAQSLDHFFTNWPEQPISRIIIDHPQDAAAVMKIYGANRSEIKDEQAVWLYSGKTGELLNTVHLEDSAAAQLYGGMIAMHTGRLASVGLRWLYFLCGLAGCAMIATGCVMWAKRIRERQKPTQSASFGLKLVESLNLAAIMGLPLATAAFFYANRLLPVGHSGRADQEVLAFFLTWAATALFAAKWRSQQGWRTLALVNALAWLLLPLCNALTTQGNLISYASKGQWALFMFDILALLAAAVFFWQSNKLQPAQQTGPQRARTERAA
ncbi:PepSY domain-containing protein [Pseudoalteromonas rubra]|uniref:PepSY domain-containing protein n=1 Tax=Pseudoalteromonas rubra TaxID=43658 RepID=A0A4Q7DZC6_9GAMM|nr:PepSY-associated TM helix domain-containing protein [Pseudoalteromonas rubra]RZM73137.1 PepSY domain-containing protein [Pseudoalteromonas rubra]